MTRIPGARLTGREIDDRHTAECKRIAARLKDRYPDHHVMDEVELRCRERIAGAPLASATTSFGIRGERRLHRPDLVVWAPPTDRALPVAIEVELSLKHTTTLARILRAWARCHLVSAVIYIASPNVERRVLRWVEATDATDRVAVVPLAAFAETSSPPDGRASQNHPKRGVA